MTWLFNQRELDIEPVTFSGSDHVVSNNVGYIDLLSSSLDGSVHLGKYVCIRIGAQCVHVSSHKYTLLVYLQLSCSVVSWYNTPELQNFRSQPMSSSLYWMGVKVHVVAKKYLKNLRESHTVYMSAV